MGLFAKVFCMFVGLIVIQQSSFAQSSCSKDDNKEATKAVEKSGIKTFKVNVSDLGGVGEGLTANSTLEEKYAIYGRAYAYAWTKAGTPQMIAVAPAAVITLTFPDGSKEDFFHIPGLNDPESNVTVAGTQYSASGAAICPSNQGNSSNNSDSKGSGPGGGTANTGGGTIVLPGQPCVKSVGTDPTSGQTYTDITCDASP